MRRRSKKGSLELSVNAIVVLVMAIAVLGIGLAFIRGGIGRAQTNVFRAIDNAELENPASPSEIVTVDKYVNVQAGKPSDIAFGFYNTEQSSIPVKPLVNCILGDGANTDIDIYVALSVGDLEVRGNSAQGFKGVIEVNPPEAGWSADSAICTACFIPAASTVVDCQDTVGIGSAQFILNIA